MGAKTTAFTTEIQKLTGDCQNAALAVAQAVSSFKPIRQQYHALTDQHAARVTELTGDKQWVAGGAPAKFAAACKGLASEQYIDGDAKIKSVNAAMVKMEASLHTWMTATNKSKEALKGEVATLKAKVDEFENYIKAKEAKWFGGKKSIPAAKEVIKTARIYISDFKAASNAS